MLIKAKISEKLMADFYNIVSYIDNGKTFI